MTDQNATAPALRGQLVVAGGGVVLDDTSLDQLADDVAGRQGAPTTRRTYGAAYRTLLGHLREHRGLGPGPIPVEAFSPRAIASWCNALEQAGRAPSTVAVHLSAAYLLAAELNIDLGPLKRATAPGTCSSGPTGRYATTAFMTARRTEMTRRSASSSSPTTFSG